MDASVNGFFFWLHSLSFWDYLKILLFPIIVDFSRSFGKSTFLLLHSIKERKKQKLRKNFQPNYKISLLIPAHNEEAGIRHALDAAINTSYKNKEIIVIDDGSTDNTYNIAQEFAKKGLIKLLHRDQSSGSKAGALNYGTAYATGDIIMCIDADTLIERKSLEEILKYFVDDKVAAVSGNVRIMSGDNGVKNLLTRIQSYEYLITMEMGRRYNAILNSLLIISGAFGAFRKEIFSGIGMYDKDTITEDFDLTVKVRKTGGKLQFATEAVSWTYCPNNWNSWWRQRIRWSHGQMKTLLKHRDIMWTRSYRLVLVMSIYDMWLMDVVFLVLRFVWLPIMILQFTDSLAYLFAFILIIYLASEIFVVMSAAILSPRKRDVQLVYLAPIMVFFYRPLYTVLRFIAFITEIFGKEVKW
jgi:cellulose synthase/poly-beta-1,6-N-acetylglucosamine synthase-like glycosyltransferase